MSAPLQRPPDAEATGPSAGGLFPRPEVEIQAGAADAADAPPTLGSLPVGARLILRCRKDWRAAAVCALTPDLVVLSVASPSGHTYRLRRPADAPLALDGHLPVLGEGTWRACFVRYDLRW